MNRSKLKNKNSPKCKMILRQSVKWCGKTWTAAKKSKSILYMQDPDTRESNILAARLKPSLLLKGETPRLIDEWQVAPVLWDSVRHEVDMRGEEGQFILTGSATPILDEQISHTGTGRISRMKMRPMSLFESNESSGEVSLKALFEQDYNIGSISNLEIEEIAKSIVRGGWPASVTSKSESSFKRAQDYVDSIVQFDVSRVDGIEKNPNKMFALLRSLSRNISTEANYSVLIKDMEGGENESISRPTIQSYMNVLQRLFVVEELEAWNPSIRSATPLRVSPKRQFVDPSIATAALGINHERLLLDFNTFGYLFESLCIRDLRIYAEALGGKVYHYRDKSGLECDAVVVLRDGRWGAVEIKLGSNEFDKAAKNLRIFSEIIDTDKMNKPSFLMIITGTKLGYKRDDGVLVVPIGCLKD
ncbi:MAG: ATP-binding protein [Peptostreptococcaceae bacterium]|nr:ATP-binding protein [Peptostreptococcaceae bacterium]